MSKLKLRTKHKRIRSREQERLFQELIKDQSNICKEFMINLNSDTNLTIHTLKKKFRLLNAIVNRKLFKNYQKCPDKRVSFIKGLFQNTLPKFMKTYKNKNQLIIHNDSDLYSSTLFTLTNSNQILTPGTIIIFDEFMSILHEFRALEDYCSSYMRKYKVIAAANLYSQVVIILE